MNRLRNLATSAVKFSNTYFNKPVKKLGLSSFTRRYNTGFVEPATVNLDRLPNRSTPWLMLHPETDKKNTLFDRFFNPEENQVVHLNREQSLGVPQSAKCIASTRGWLGFVDPNGECPVYLTSPFDVKDVIRLPSLAQMPGIVDLERDSISGEILMVKKREFCSRQFSKRVEQFVMLTPEEFFAQEQILNLTLSCSDPRRESCAVAAVQGDEPSKTRVSYCRPGDDEEGCWKLGVNALDKHVRTDFIRQVTFSETRKLFYAIQDGDIYSLNLHDDMSAAKTVKFIEKEDVKGKKMLTAMHFVEPYVVALEDGTILYVTRHYNENYEKDDYSYQKRVSETSSFQVFRVDFDSNKVQRVDSIGDRAIFIGPNDSFSLSARSYTRLLPNSIYFVEHKRESPEKKLYHKGEVRAFNLANKAINTCYASPEEQDIEDFEDLSFNTDQLFWVSPQNLSN